MTHSLRRLVTQPGFNCVCCCIGESVAGGMSLRIQQIDCRCGTKTKDNVFVDINITVQYQIERENLYDAFYKLTDSRWVVGLLLDWGACLSCLSRLSRSLAVLTRRRRRCLCRCLQGSDHVGGYWPRRRGGIGWPPLHRLTRSCLPPSCVVCLRRGARAGAQGRC